MLVIHEVMNRTNVGALNFPRKQERINKQHIHANRWKPSSHMSIKVPNGTLYLMAFAFYFFHFSTEST